MKHTEDEIDQINEGYQRRDDAVAVIITAISFAALFIIIAFACYVLK